MQTCLKVPAKNSPALPLFLSRGKEEERKTTISCFAPAEEEQSRGILGGNFQTRVHDGNKAAVRKVTTCFLVPVVESLRVASPTADSRVIRSVGKTQPRMSEFSTNLCDFFSDLDCSLLSK